jgi:hypothetical protein
MFQSNSNQEKRETLQNQIDTALAEYKQAYINYKLNPEIPDYGDTVQKIQMILTGIKKDIFILKNKLYVDIDEYNKKMVDLKRGIDEEKRRYKRKEKKWGQVKGTEATSLTLFSNFQENYKYQFLYNMGLLTGIFMLITLFLYYKRAEQSHSNA